MVQPKIGSDLLNLAFGEKIRLESPFPLSGNKAYKPVLLIRPPENGSPRTAIFIIHVENETWNPVHLMGTAYTQRAKDVQMYTFDPKFLSWSTSGPTPLGPSDLIYTLYELRLDLRPDTSVLISDGASTCTASSKWLHDKGYDIRNDHETFESLSQQEQDKIGSTIDITPSAFHNNGPAKLFTLVHRGQDCPAGRVALTTDLPTGRVNVMHLSIEVKFRGLGLGKYLMGHVHELHQNGMLCRDKGYSSPRSMWIFLNASRTDLIPMFFRMRYRINRVGWSVGRSG